MINVGKLWRKGSFKNIPATSKMIYIYLITSPNLTGLGLLNISPDTIQSDLNISTQELRENCKAILNKNLIHIFNIGGDIFFFIPNHFKSISKSENNIEKCKDEVSSLPAKLFDLLHTKELLPDLDKYFTFVPPTVEQVEEFCLSEGYMIDAEEFISFYEGQGEIQRKQGWYDTRGKRVRNWKQKLKLVWFKNDRRLNKCEDAPKGFEYFFVRNGNRIIQPDGWREGKPYSKNFTDNTVLKDEYKNRTKTN